MINMKKIKVVCKETTGVLRPVVSPIFKRKGNPFRDGRLPTTGTRVPVVFKESKHQKVNLKFQEDTYVI